MEIDLKAMHKVYNALGDEVSKEIFMNRIMYSVSGDIRWMRNTVLSNKKIKEFAAAIKAFSQEKEVVIFGAGKGGKNLYDMLNDVPWKCFVDTHPKYKELGGVPIIPYCDFVANYQGEYVVISSRMYWKEMKTQLARSGITDRVVDFGEIWEEVMQDQYFDLDYMQPSNEKEIFVDVGCYDAQSSVNFAAWCKGNGFVYAFEPDFRRREECIYNLESNEIDYKLIPKGVWKEETTLHFKLSDGMKSSISKNGEEIVEVISLDKALSDEKITFIKMDIEGSEIQALNGAKEIIVKNRPRLAISVYHRPEDIFLIPNIILQYYHSYRFYFRHYSICHSETVLYALPKE